MHVIEGYGSTEAGAVFVDGQIRRPPVIDYKLVDVPDLGYFGTDVPHPRGELLVKSDQLFPGYYKRPEVTAEVFDANGYYRTGDVVAELGPDRLQYLDRRNNVLKLSQGEFVTVSKLEAAFGDSPLIRQIFVYGNSARPYLLAVVVPTEDALSRYGADELKAAINASLKEAARAAGLQSYEIPRDFIIETTPFTLENGLLTGIRKLAWPRLKERYGPQLEQLYVDLADSQAGELRALRQSGADRPVLETVSRAASALLGAAASDVRGDAQFTDLGGDSLSALTFANLLHEIFGVDVPVGVIVSPASDLASIAAYVEAERAGGSKRPTYAAVHGRDATEVHARDLTLDKFFDSETLSAAASLPGPAKEIRTVLLTGATGFLGRYLALEWLERMDLVDGKVICLVRAKDDAAARARLDATFDSGDPKLLEHYRTLAADHLEVFAGDKGEANLGLDDATWQRLADTVDLIVDPAALVNHVLPYSQLFGPNVLGTAELIRIALTTKIKPFVYVSTMAVGAGMDPAANTEDADVRVVSATRNVDDSYANGYGNSKWGGEVLLREANEQFGLPVSVFRCDMILADTTYAGQLNLPDMFTRMMLSPRRDGRCAAVVLRARCRGQPAARALRRVAGGVHRRRDLDAGRQRHPGVRDLPRDEPVRRRHRHGRVRGLAHRCGLSDPSRRRLRLLVAAVRDHAAGTAREAARRVAAAAAAQLPEAGAPAQRLDGADGPVPGGGAGREDRSGQGHSAYLIAGDRQVRHRLGAARPPLTLRFVHPQLRSVAVA